MILKKKPKLNKKYLPAKQPFVSLEKGLLKSTDVKAITFARKKNGSKILLGAGVFGEVYLGQVDFFNGKETVKKRVAIKRFKEGIKLTDTNALEYQKVIDSLRTIYLEKSKRYPNRSTNARFFPKAAMLKLVIDGKPEWVMVSQAFYSKKKGPKLTHCFSYKDIQTILKDPKKLDAYLDEFCWSTLKVVEKFGYSDDIFNNLNRFNFLAIDIDCLVYSQNKLTTKQKAESLVSSFFILPSGEVEVKKKAFKKFLSLKMDKELKQEFIKEIKKSKTLKEDSL